MKDKVKMKDSFESKISQSSYKESRIYGIRNKRKCEEVEDPIKR